LYFFAKVEKMALLSAGCSGEQHQGNGQGDKDVEELGRQECIKRTFVPLAKEIAEACFQETETCDEMTCARIANTTIVKKEPKNMLHSPLFSLTSSSLIYN
jgi:hypothetical protein